MTGKSGPQKHSKRDMLAKEKASTQNAGGGSAGAKDRKGGSAGHSKFVCPHCQTPAHNLQTMKIHHESKHPKVTWDENAYADKHAEQGGTTQGVAVRGSVKDKQRR